MAVPDEPAGLPLWSDYTAVRASARGLDRRLLMVRGPAGRLRLVAAAAVHLSRRPRRSRSRRCPSTSLPSTAELAPPEVTIDTDAQLLHSPEVLGAVGGRARHRQRARRMRAPLGHRVPQQPRAPRDRDGALRAGGRQGGQRGRRRARRRPARRARVRSSTTSCASCALSSPPRRTCSPRSRATRLVIPATDDLFAQVARAAHRPRRARGGPPTPAEVVEPARAAAAPTTPTPRSRSCPGRCSGCSPAACSAPAATASAACAAPSSSTVLTPVRRPAGHRHPSRGLPPCSLTQPTNRVPSSALPGRPAPPGGGHRLPRPRRRSPGGSTPPRPPTTYTSTARVLVNPSVGNPFVPTPASVRQDELTSLETEAQVVRSDGGARRGRRAGPDR